MAVTGALLVAILPVLPVYARGPVSVSSAQVRTSVDRERLVRLPIEASHVALQWTGAPEARLGIAFGLTPTTVGERVAVDVDDDANLPDGATASGVLWTGGARFARVTTDQPLRELTVIAIDSVDRRPGIHAAPPTAVGAVGQPSVISRAGWGADESYRFDSGGYERFAPSFFPLQKAIVHHTAGRNDDPDPAATIRAIYYLHAVTRGYGDIDYNFLIDWQGRVYEGRHSRDYAPGEPITGEDLAGDGVRGSHAKDFNAGTVGVALLGTYTTVLPPAAQRNALVGLLAWKLERHGIDPLGSGTYVNPESGTTKNLPAIAGHRNVNATACPGDAFYATFPALRQDVAARIGATTGTTVDHTAPSVLSMTAMVPNPTGATTIPFGLIFSEPIADLAADDLEVGGDSAGWAVGSINGAGATWSITVRAPPGSLPDEGSVTLTLAGASVLDLAGHPGPPAAVMATASYVHDDVNPTVILWQTPHKSISNAGFFDWTVNFSEPVTGLEVADVSIGGPNGGTWYLERILGSGAEYIFTTRQATPSDGIYTVQLPAGSVQDLAGNPLDASDVVKLTVDRSAPTVSTPLVSLRQGTTLNGSRLRVEVSWKGTDVGPAGIASYDVARSYDGRAFEVVSTGRTSTTMGWTITPGHTYRFEVRARDRAGNVSGWVAGPTLRPALVQQTSSAVHFSGSYRTTYYSKYSGGSERYLRTAGSSVTYTTTARSLSFVTTVSGTRGQARIYVDGVLRATVNLNGSPTTYRYVAFAKTWSSRGTHTIKVVSVGTPVPRVDIDAFGVIR